MGGKRPGKGGERGSDKASEKANGKVLRGLVLRSTAGFVDIETDEGVVRARLRGRLKKEKLKTDLCVIGDRVEVRVQTRGDEAREPTVESVEARRSVFSRQHPGRGAHQEDVLIANLDLLVCVFSASLPLMKTSLVDRFLAIAEANEIDAIIVLNKADEDPEGLEECLELLEPHQALGYELFVTSAEDGRGVGALRERIGGVISAFVGPSGVGKSSLLNRIEEGLDLRVGETSLVEGKGRHTTRVATLFPLTGGGYIADTPGIRELAAFDLDDRSIARAFRELREFEGQCAFRNCLHLEEPNCAVADAVDEGKIDAGRYESYLKMLLGEERPDRHGA